MGAIAIAPGTKAAEANTMKTASLTKIEDNIFRFFDGEDFIQNMIVGSKYSQTFGIALISANYARVSLKRKLKLKALARRLTDVEHQYTHEDEKDELSIRYRFNNKIRKLVISKK